MQEIELKSVPLFANLSPQQLERLSLLSHTRTYQAGDLVFREGEAGIGVFVVTSGIFELRHDAGSGDGHVEATLTPGQVFGLTSLLDDEPRRVSAYAVETGTCAILTRMTFRAAMDENPQLATEVIRSMAGSLRAVSALVPRNEPSGGSDGMAA